jgi:hypothetical protein
MNNSQWLRWVGGAGVMAVVVCVFELESLPDSLFTWPGSLVVAESEGREDGLPVRQTAKKPKTVLTEGRTVTANVEMPGSQEESRDPAEVLEKVAETILYGPPLVVDFQGQANLEVALRPLKSVRGQSSIVPMSGTFSSLGQGTGLAKWQLNVGAPHAVTFNLVSQRHETLVYSSVPGAVQGVVSTQPDWFGTIDPERGNSNFGATSLYGSPASLVQWLPHHMECFWGDVAEVPLPVQRLTLEPTDQGSHAELQRVTIVGLVRPTVAGHFGIFVPETQGVTAAGRGLELDDWQVFAGWARQVPVPLPHVAEIYLRSEPNGVLKLERVAFFRVHPLRPELEEMVRFEWGSWRVAAELTPEDIVARAEKP